MLSSFSRLYVTIFRDALPRRFSLATLALLAACDPTSRPNDTLGLQSTARWEWHGRLVVKGDSTLTLVRMAIDTTHGGGDVALAIRTSVSEESPLTTRRPCHSQRAEIGRAHV